MTTLRGPGYSGGRSLFGGKARWIVALVLVLISIITYCSSTAYNPEQRIEQIQAAIQEEFPKGVPEGLIQ